MASIADKTDCVQHFWGMVLEAKKPFTLSLTQTELQITQATYLGEGSATLFAGTPTVKALPLCVLGGGASSSGIPRSALLDLNFFPEDESVTLSVQGPGAISIVGTLATFGSIPDDEDEEEEEEEEEVAAGKGGAKGSSKGAVFVPAPEGDDGAGDEAADEELELENLLGDDDEEEDEGEDEEDEEEEDGVDDDEDLDEDDDDEEEEEEEREQKEKAAAASAAAAAAAAKKAAAASESNKRKREGEGQQDSLQLSKKQAPSAPAAAAAAAAATAAADKKQAPSAPAAKPAAAAAAAAAAGPALGEWYSVPNTQNKVKARDLVVGRGAVAGKGCKVTVAYKGSLKSGKQFDASRSFSFNLLKGDVIKGWDVGVFGMREGGTRELIIHPDYGYGKKGAGGDIPPQSTLCFTVELFKSHLR